MTVAESESESESVAETVAETVAESETVERRRPRLLVSRASRPPFTWPWRLLCVGGLPGFLVAVIFR